MASIDLTELIPDLELELNAPGVDGFPTVSDVEWVNRLRNGFWTAVLDDLIVGYKEVDGSIAPVSSAYPTFPRDQQQLIIMYAVITVIRQQLMDMNTTFRAKAGPVEYEVQKSAVLLKGLLDEFAARRNNLIIKLAQSEAARDIYYINGYISRQNAIDQGYAEWVGA